MKIKKLPQSVISKIAAGEVIERPVYVVKELVENSLDAGASVVKVIVEESGLKRITVIDDGEGMEVDDLMESFKPHATSKLQTIEDLQKIMTMGFRGEALSSIAAISTMTISTRTASSSSGNAIIISDGEASEIKPFGMPIGTHITVENLFHAIPARKKFLKSQRTEFRHMIDVMTHFAFSHPQVQFVLIHNGKTIFDLPKTNDSLERIEMLLGKDVFAHILPVQFSDNYVTLQGFITKPQITTKTPHKHFLFINNRKVNDKGISQAIKSGFGTLLEKDTYPVAILSLSMPHEMVDVNVHPKKDEVKFLNAKELLFAVEHAVIQTLAEHDIAFGSHAWKQAVFLGEEDIYSDKSTKTLAAKLLKEQQLPWKLLQPIKSDPASILQMHNLYLLTPTEFGLAIVDQHAAHERILYEQFLNEFEHQKRLSKIYTYAKPKLIALDFSESELLLEHLETFAQYGLLIEPFQKNNFLLRSVPELFQDRDPKQFISEVLENLRIDLKVDIDSFSQKMIAYLACRGAVKAGDALTKKQSYDLLMQLEKTTNNATCPHGRPTKVLVDLEMLHKMFKR